MLPANHPLWTRLARSPYRGWSRLHQAVRGLKAKPLWEPKHLGIRAWPGLSLFPQETTSPSPGYAWLVAH